MFVIPAIDLMGGMCVRLVQGNFDDKTTYSNNPVEVAQHFEKEGAQYIHIVDLDGAKSGIPVHTDLILSIAKAISIPVQVGGGIRAYDQAKKYLDQGVHKIILGTAAIEDTSLLERLLTDFDATRIAVSVDMKNGYVATRGWVEQGTKTITEFIPELKNRGVQSVIVTDISKDGLLGGPNFDVVKPFINEGFYTVASGGITSLSDIKECHKLGASGAVVGKAFYEKKLAIRTAQKQVLHKQDGAKRIIPCLDVNHGRVVKGIHFGNLRDAGDPVEMGKQYCDQGADELIFLDVSATLEDRKIFHHMISAIAAEINIPFSVGGGISVIEDIKQLLYAGADKVSIGSAAAENPTRIQEATQYFGSQCITISVDAKKQQQGWTVYIRGGTENTGLDAVAFSKKMEQLGAGELLVNSLDRDGTKLGFDLDLLGTIAHAVNIPVIASSGAGSLNDFLTVFQQTNVDAALGATLFHYKETGIAELKKFLYDHHIPIRL